MTRRLEVSRAPSTFGELRVSVQNVQGLRNIRAKMALVMGVKGK